VRQNFGRIQRRTVKRWPGSVPASVAGLPPGLRIAPTAGSIGRASSSGPGGRSRAGRPGAMVGLTGRRGRNTRRWSLPGWQRARGVAGRSPGAHRSTLTMTTAATATWVFRIPAATGCMELDAGRPWFMGSGQRRSGERRGCGEELGVCLAVVFYRKGDTPQQAGTKLLTVSSRRKRLSAQPGRRGTDALTISTVCARDYSARSRLSRWWVHGRR
jgi:hypothetical protein